MLERRTIWKGLLIAALTCALVSCSALRSPQKNEALVPVEKKTFQRQSLPPDAVVFDVLMTRIPYQERDIARAVWQDADEQEIDPETKRRLNEQGFRVGVIGASPPESLSLALSLKGRELRSSLEEEVDLSKVEATNAPLARSKPVTLRSGAKSVIEMQEEVLPTIPILENENGSLVGKSYTDARPMFSVAIEPISDGSVRFDVSPFLRYGQPQTVTRYQHGQLVRAQEQPAKSFDRLKFSVQLRPGQFLVLGAAESESNILGRCFFGDGSIDFDQKLLVLRLLVTQRDGQFDRFPDFNELISREFGDEGQANDDSAGNSEVQDGENERGGFEDYERMNGEEIAGEPATVDLDGSGGSDEKAETNEDSAEIEARREQDASNAAKVF